MKTIASRQNPIVRACRDLADRPDSTGARLLLDGAHLVREAAEAGLEYEVVCVASSHVDRRTEAGDLAMALDDRGVNVAVMPDKLFTAISPVRTPSGIVAIAKRRGPAPRASDIVSSRTAIVLVGVDIQEPGNVGALLRVTEAAGGGGVLLTGQSASPFSWKALRGSMGSGLRLPVLHDPSPASVFETLRARQVGTVAAVARGGLAPDAVAWPGRVALVVGGEGPGLSSDIVARCDQRVTIPMAPPVESLNVTVAAAILLYGARRQRESMQDGAVGRGVSPAADDTERGASTPPEES
jgi:TrmH family RNA methyltransferase